MTDRPLEALLTLSVVSHKQQHLVNDLLNDLQACTCQTIKVNLTLNLPEILTFSVADYSFPIHITYNQQAKGFGENHNQAFAICDTPYFCVINPDIRLLANPFNSLIAELDNYAAALIAPKVVNPDMAEENSVRKFQTPLTVLKKVIFKKVAADYSTNEVIINPDWVGGMFMLFNSKDFAEIGGFDERYFLYYEDVDICKSLHESKKMIVFTPNISVIHAARRTSHSNFKYLMMHIKSMLRFFAKWKLKQLFRIHI